MRVFSLLLLSGFVAACDGGETGDDTGDTNTGPVIGEFDYYIDVAEAPVGELACYTPGGAWLTQSVDTALQISEERTELIEDFETERAVDRASVELWYGDVVTGAADVVRDANDSGQVTFSAPSCTPVAYRTTTPDNLGNEGAKDTYESHQIFAPLSAAEASPFNSVSKTTYLVILSLLGVSADDTLGTIAGAVYDCNGDPIEKAQVVVVDDEGNIPEQLVVKYFIENFPARDQPHTSEDGLWTAMNLPPGNWTVQAWTYNGTDHDLLGSTSLQIFADSINISNIYVGFEHGLRYPDACLVTE